MFTDQAAGLFTSGKVFQKFFCTILLPYQAILTANSAFGLDFTAPSAVIFGDSISVGAATHPILEFDGPLIWEALNGRVDVSPNPADVPWLGGQALEAPELTLPTKKEIIFSPFQASSDILSQALTAHFLNTEEYSWGYQVAKKLGISGSNIVVSGFGGARVKDFSTQVLRFLERSKGQLTQYVFVTFTGNDLCSTPTYQITEPEVFESYMARGLEMLKAAKPHPEGTTIVLTNILPLTQLALDQELLTKSVKAFGKSVTCRELRESSFLPPKDYTKQSTVGMLLPPQLFPPNPAFMCPNLFAPEKFMKENLAEIATTANLYRDSLSKLNSTFKNDGKNIRLVFVKETSAITLKPDDIAVDCFHLSAAGQRKIGEIALKNLGL